VGWYKCASLADKNNVPKRRRPIACTHTLKVWMWVLDWMDGTLVLCLTAESTRALGSPSPSQAPNFSACFSSFRRVCTCSHAITPCDSLLNVACCTIDLCGGDGGDQLILTHERLAAGRLHNCATGRVTLEYVQSGAAYFFSLLYGRILFLGNLKSYASRIQAVAKSAVCRCVRG